MLQNFFKRDLTEEQMYEQFLLIYSICYKSIFIV